MGTLRIGRVIEQLQLRLARGGMTYHEAVTIDHLISVFERIRSRRVQNLESRRTTTLVLSETVCDALRRGESS